MWSIRHEVNHISPAVVNARRNFLAIGNCRQSFKPKALQSGLWIRAKQISFKILDKDETGEEGEGRKENGGLKQKQKKTEV